MKRRWIGALAAVLCCQACMSGTPPPLTDTTQHPKLAAPVDVGLPFGEDEVVPGTDLTLGFDSVLVDHRCPSDFTCQTPGNAIVRIRVVVGSDAPLEILLNTVSPYSIGLGAYQITVLDLSPLPETYVPLPQSRYDLKLRVGSI